MDRVVGIDVAKARLDVFCLATGRRHAVSNDPNGIAGWPPGSRQGAWW